MHTKGPWWVEGDFISSGAILVLNVMGGPEGRGIPICRLFSLSKDDETTANAHLLKMAPDMFEHLALLAEKGDWKAEEIIRRAKGE